MLKWKRLSVTAGLNAEELVDALAGMSGKNRVIKFLTIEDKVAGEYLRMYRDAEQIVDLEATTITDSFPLLPVDLTLAEGQLCKVGFYNTGSSQTRTISIGYEEAG